MFISGAAKGTKRLPMAFKAVITEAIGELVSLRGTMGELGPGGQDMSILCLSRHLRYAKGGGEPRAWRLFKAFESEGAAFLAAAPSLETLPPGCEVMSIGQRRSG